MIDQVASMEKRDQLLVEAVEKLQEARKLFGTAMAEIKSDSVRLRMIGEQREIDAALKALHAPMEAE